MLSISYICPVFFNYFSICFYPVEFSNGNPRINIISELQSV